MPESVVERAIAWGFNCNQDSDGNWEISPRSETERWLFKLVDDRWVLFVGGVAQIRCHPTEAIAFLERQREGHDA